MTEKKRARDVKAFTELVKAEAVKLGDYDRLCSAVTALNIEDKLRELIGTLHAANFTAVYYHESVIEQAAAIGALALSVAVSSRQALADYEALRA